MSKLATHQQSVAFPLSVFFFFFFCHSFENELFSIFCLMGKICQLRVHYHRNFISLKLVCVPKMSLLLPGCCWLNLVWSLLLVLLISFSYDHQCRGNANAQQQTTPTASASSSSSSTSLPRIAICIGGQHSRMQPRLFQEGLLNPNNEYFYFDLFYNIQVANGMKATLSSPGTRTSTSTNTNTSSSSTTHNSNTFPTHNRDEVIFNTDPGVTFNSSTFGKMDLSMVVQRLHEIVNESSHAKIVSLQFHHLLPLEEVTKQIGYNLTLFEIDVMKAASVQSTILNMYLHQIRCINQINDYEKQHGFTYDYVISTREDVIFIRSMNLTHVLSILDEPSKHEVDPITQKPTRKCHMVTKDCANFRGLNQRMFIYDRQSANITLSNRWNYYRYLLQEQKVLFNTEVFELEMAKYYKLKACPVFIDHYAVTAVRPVDGDWYCYPFWETFKCLPTNTARMVGKQRCDNFRHHARPIHKAAPTIAPATTTNN